MRVRVAAVLLLGVLATLGAVQAQAAPAIQKRYQCEERQKLVIIRSPSNARVEFIDRAYELHRKASSIGQKYTSRDAALIIDGTSAVFVAQDRLQLGTCVEASETAVAG